MRRQREEIYQRLRRSVVAPVLAIHANRARQLTESYRRAYVGPVARAAEAFRRARDEALPPNLRDVSYETLGSALTITAGGGPCLVWAPRRELVEALVTEESYKARGALLLEHRQEVPSDVETLLHQAIHSCMAEQDEARTAALTALAAARDGHDMAAQALTAAGLTRIVEGVLGYGRLGDARERMASQDIEDAVLRVMRLVAIELATVNSLNRTDQDPEGFNRHGTAHGYLTFYSEADLLGALLLLSAWIRELSWWAEHEPAVFDGSGEGD